MLITLENNTGVGRGKRERRWGTEILGYEKS